MKKLRMFVSTAVVAWVLGAACGGGEGGGAGGGPGTGGEFRTGGNAATGGDATGGNASGQTGGNATAGNAGTGGRAGGHTATGGRTGGHVGTGGRPSGGAGMAGAPSVTGGAGAASGGVGGGAAATCTSPSFTTSDTNGGWSNGGYYVHNNVWNADEAGPETLFACSFRNWYVRSTQPNTTSVKAYPNVHLDINDLKGSPLANYTTITSTFAATTPQVGIYDVAYDLWLDGVGWGNGTTEVMIWTENRKQVPLGKVVASEMAFGAKKYDIYHYTSSADGGVQVVSFLSTTTQTSGSLDLKAMLSWIVGKGWIIANATINQIGYGVEICSTDNQPATFTFTDFSVTLK